MTQTMPTVSAEIPEGDPCRYGFCTKPAATVVHIDYPTTPERDAFRWTSRVCEEDLAVERAAAAMLGAVVTTEPIPVTA